MQRPRYDRAAVATGIVHLGIGAFQRAHQAMYTEAALNAGDLRWGVVGASLPAVSSNFSRVGKKWVTVSRVLGLGLVPGAFVGSRVAARMPMARLRSAFGGALVLVACWFFVHQLLHLV